jgi:hypothetical protein
MGDLNREAKKRKRKRSKPGQASPAGPGVAAAAAAAAQAAAAKKVGCISCWHAREAASDSTAVVSYLNDAACTWACLVPLSDCCQRLPSF